MVRRGGAARRLGPFPARAAPRESEIEFLRRLSVRVRHWRPAVVRREIEMIREMKVAEGKLFKTK